MAEKKIVPCDTNIIIDLFKDKEKIIEKIRSIGEDSISISSITAAELYFGALNRTELRLIKGKLNRIIHIPINEHITEIFEDLMLNFSLSHKIGIPDALIASTAIYYKIKLFTANTKDFIFIPDLVLF